jgi:hypothetical protein
MRISQAKGILKRQNERKGKKKKGRGHKCMENVTA